TSALDGIPLPLPRDLCVVKCTSIVLYSLREYYRTSPLDIPLRGGAFAARRIGLCLCIADREQYSPVYLGDATTTPILPISQAPQEPGATASIDDSGRRRRKLSMSHSFLDGRGYDGRIYQCQRGPTLQWPNHPLSIGLEYPYVMALLPDQTIQVHNVESQEIAQEVPAPPLPSPNETSLGAERRRALAMGLNGFLVLSQRQSEKLKLKRVGLLDRNGKPGGREVVAMFPVGSDGTGEQSTLMEDRVETRADEIETSVGAAPYDV
ncbi:hypothetical protein BC826DRAFT_1044091, partial [Russula brevipes]